MGDPGRLTYLRPIHDRWESGLRRLQGGDNVLRYRVALSGIACILGAWLAFAADKPWKFGLTHAASRNLGKIVGFYSFWAGALNLGLLGILIWTAPWCGRWRGSQELGDDVAAVPFCPFLDWSDRRDDLRRDAGLTAPQFRPCT
jgi:hypothetical protein